MCGIHGICVRGPRPGDQVIGHVVGVDVLQDLGEGLGAADQTVSGNLNLPASTSM